MSITTNKGIELSRAHCHSAVHTKMNKHYGVVVTTPVHHSDCIVSSVSRTRTQHEDRIPSLIASWSIFFKSSWNHNNWETIINEDHNQHQIEPALQAVLSFQDVLNSESQLLRGVSVDYRQAIFRYMKLTNTFSYLNVLSCGSCGRRMWDVVEGWKMVRGSGWDMSCSTT